MNIEHILLRGIKCSSTKRSMYYFWIIKRFELLVSHSLFIGMEIWELDT